LTAAVTIAQVPRTRNCIGTGRKNFAQADALLFGRVTYEMMEAAWRWPAHGRRPEGMADWMEPFARAIDAAKKYVVSSALHRVDWNAELVRGDLLYAIQQLKALPGGPGNGLFVGGVKLPLALAELGLIDEYEFLIQPPARGPRANIVRGPLKVRRPETHQPTRIHLRRGGIAV
jgi:dihydrofolate reductase